MPIAQSLKRRFLSLAARLSPENLTRDGEADADEIEAAEREIGREWRELERQAGRTVSEEDVRRWERDLIARMR